MTKPRKKKATLPKVRSLTTIDQLDQRLTAVREFKALANRIIDDHGGLDRMNVTKRGLVDALAMTLIIQSNQNAVLLTGGSVSIDDHIKVSNRLITLAKAVGIDPVDIEKTTPKTIHDIRKEIDNA